MRLFVAVDLDDELRDKLYQIESILRKYRGLKAVEKRNIHFTLKFLGEVPDSRVDTVKEGLSKVIMQPFRAHLKGVGFFPNQNHIRVVWVGVDEGSSEMSRLAMAINDKMKNLGFKGEKEFVPHATVARVKRMTPEERKGLLKELQHLEDDFGWMEVRDFRLKKSTLTPKGPIYEDIMVYPLGEKDGS